MAFFLWNCAAQVMMKELKRHRRNVFVYFKKIVHMKYNKINLNNNDHNSKYVVCPSVQFPLSKKKGFVSSNCYSNRSVELLQRCSRTIKKSIKYIWTLPDLTTNIYRFTFDSICTQQIVLKLSTHTNVRLITKYCC